MRPLRNPTPVLIRVVYSICLILLLPVDLICLYLRRRSKPINCSFMLTFNLIILYLGFLIAYMFDSVNRFLCSILRLFISILFGVLGFTDIITAVIDIFKRRDFLL